jgi:N-acyl-D-aspartate/D-glutamate deacylase
MQGVTTVVTGNDGGGPVRIAETLARWEKRGTATNVALLVGHGTVRRDVLGMADAAPSPEQLEAMKNLVRAAMQEGAFGLSSGLYYVPGNYAKTAEVVELARVVGAAGGLYDSHIRDESSYNIGLVAAIEEAIQVGREAGLPVNISHIKCLGTEVWGKSGEVVEIIQKARAAGVRVTADQYPYIASGSSLVAALLPQWAQEGGREAVLARLNDPNLRPRLLEEMTRNLKRRNGPEALLFRSANAPELRGKTLADVAQARNLPPVETAIELIREYTAKGVSGLATVSFNMNDDDVVRFMKQDFVMTGSDGSSGHPRMYGTYPRKYREYVLGKKVMPAERFIHVSSAMPAQIFGIAERGMIREGYFADVVVFNPATYAERATYEKPEELAAGMQYVVVNGQLAVENGVMKGVAAGRGLKRAASSR